LSPTLADEKSKYLEYFLIWYHLITAKARASRITTVKIPPKKARATEELEDIARQLAGELGMVVLEVILGSLIVV